MQYLFLRAQSIISFNASHSFRLIFSISIRASHTLERGTAKIGIFDVLADGTSLPARDQATCRHPVKLGTHGHAGIDFIRLVEAWVEQAVP